MRLDKLKYGDPQGIERQTAYDDLMSGIIKKKLRCWNKKAPEGFDKA